MTSKAANTFFSLPLTLHGHPLSKANEFGAKASEPVGGSTAVEPVTGAKASEPVGGSTAVEPNGVPNEDYSNVFHIFWDPKNKRTFFCCDASCDNPIHIQNQADYYDDKNNYVDNLECKHGIVGCTGSGCSKCLGE